MKRNLEEGGYKSETLSEECGQGITSSSMDSSFNNEEETNGEEDPTRQSTIVKSNRQSFQDYVY